MVKSTIKMRTIRVKQQNQAAIIAALVQAGYTATPCEANLAQVEYEMNAFSNSENWTFDSIINMAGISTSASGKQANKIISALKADKLIN